MEFISLIKIEDSDTTLVYPNEEFVIDRCNKATGRKIKLIKISDKIKEILKGADQLDRWNGSGSGYVYIREEIEEMSNLILDHINE